MHEIVEIFHEGGIFMYGILLTSLISLTLILRRLFDLWIGFRIDATKLHDQVSSLIASGEYSKATQITAGSHPLQRMMLAALMRANRSEKEIRRAVETSAVTELGRFRRGTAMLPQLSNIATLLGLLGTISGLIQSFQGMGKGGDAASRAAALSSGVSVAFFNTFFGLTVATVTVVFYLIISSKQAREMEKMEHGVSSLIDQLLSGAPAKKGRVAAGEM